MRLIQTVLIASLCAACGSSSTPPKPDAFVPVDIGFNKPTASLKANNNETEIGAADLSCLGTPSTDTATTVSVTLNSIVKDFQSKDPVPQAMVTVFDGIDYTHPFDMKSSDANGLVTFTIPMGHTRFGFQMNGSTVLQTFLLNQYIDPNMALQPAGSDTDPTKRMTIQSVSNSTAATLPALIGETRTPGTGVLAGAMRDCGQHEISNFIATVSSTPATAMPITGAETYYFSPGVDLPAHHPKPGVMSNGLDASSGNGLFMVIQLPAAPTAYVQIWGYPTDADVTADNLKEIAELKVPVLADTVITGSFEPLRQ